MHGAGPIAQHRKITFAGPTVQVAKRDAIIPLRSRQRIGFGDERVALFVSIQTIHDPKNEIPQPVDPLRRGRRSSFYFGLRRAVLLRPIF